MQKSSVTKAVTGLRALLERNVSETNAKVGKIVISVLCPSVHPLKSFNTSLLSTSCVPDSALGLGNRVVSKSDKAPCPIRVHMMKIRGSGGRRNCFGEKVMVLFLDILAPRYNFQMKTPSGLQVLRTEKLLSWRYAEHYLQRGGI